jgi:VCBS repeat-containing protein
MTSHDFFLNMTGAIMPLNPWRRRARSLSRHRRRVLAELLESRTLLSDITVDLFVDENDGNRSPGDVSLREAILMANSLPGADRVLLQAGTYTLSLAGAGENGGLTGDLDINGDLDVVGVGVGGTTINGNQIDRVFDARGGSYSSRITVNLSGLTVTGGRTPDGVVDHDGGGIQALYTTLNLSECVVQNNRTGAGGSFGGFGGGIDIGLGAMSILNSVITQNTTGSGTNVGGQGGGLSVNTAATTITASVITNNRTGDGQAGSNLRTAGDGGGIYLENANLVNGVRLVVPLTVVNSSVSGNAVGTTTLGEGGGISAGGFTDLFIENSTIATNTAANGAGIYINSGTIDRILNASIAGNTATGGEGGGGIRNEAGTILLIEGTTISGNQAANSTGVFNGGGGIYSQGTIGTIVNSTISGNSANGVGGGIALLRNIDRIANTTIANNSASDAGGLFLAKFSNLTPVIGELVNTIIADNTAVGANPKDFERLGQVNAAASNLVEDPNGHTITTGAAGNLVGVDPRLGPLADNGGPTKTHALLAGSPALNSGLNASAPATDQRGLPRPSGVTVDIGAFEVQGLAPNRAPVANDDAYTVSEDGVLVVPAPQGPVLRYGFDEAGSGTARALDSGAAPPANADLLSGATRTASTPGGASRGALDLTADGAVINYATPGVDVNKIDALGSMTVTLWLNLRANPSGGDILLSDLSASGAPAGTGGWELGVDTSSSTYSASNTTLIFQVFERASSTVANGQGKLLAGLDANQKWVFLALTFSANRTLLTYRASETTPVTADAGSSLFTIPLRDNTTPLGIGGSALLTNVDHTPPAWMDDIRIYNRVLTGAELEAVRQEDLVRGNGVLANDSDPENDPLTAILVGGPAHGSLTFNADGTFHYLPIADYNGPDSFTYKVSDGALESAPATVAITVTPVNDAPVATLDTYTTLEDTPLAVPAPGLLGNDTDVDGDRLTATLVSPPSLGTIVLNPDGSFTYTPIPNAYTTGNLPDLFIYKVSDGALESRITPVRVFVTPVNDPPAANDDTATVAEDGGPAAIDVLANDSLQFDPDETLSIIGVTQGAHGTVAFTATGLSYTPNPNFAGTDAFLYTVSDGNGGTDIATVTVTVTPVNDAPIAADDLANTAANMAVTVAVLANDTDVDGDTLGAQLVSGPTHGMLTLNADGSFTYTPAAGYVGVDGFTYTASDGRLVSATATVTLVITVPPPATPDLTAASDTGVSSSDNLTRLDNSGPARVLQFLVTGTLAGATVMLEIDDPVNGPVNDGAVAIVIGSAVASGSSTLVTTDGISTLANGSLSIRARQSLSNFVSGPSPALTVGIDATSPVADIVDVTPDPRNSAVDTIIISFAEPVGGFDLADLRLTRDGGANLLTAAQTLTSGDGRTWTLGNLAGLTSVSGGYLVSLRAANSGIADAAGNLLVIDASDAFLVDRTAPTADVVDVTPDPRRTPVGSITIVFSEPVVGFDRADLRLARNGGANLLTAAQTLTTVDGRTWTLGNLAGLTAAPGQYVLTVSAAGSGIADAAGNPLAANASDLFLVRSRTAADSDGDGKTDVAVYGYGRYAINPSSGGSTFFFGFGGPDDRPLAGDYDGDGKTDIAVYGYGRYAFNPSSGGPTVFFGFGGPEDRPVVGDYDGDGKTDIAVYGYGRFAYNPSSGGPTVFFGFGGPDDRPVTGDYDGDGKTDIAVYGYGRFAYNPSSGGQTVFFGFGGPEDRPLVGDYDGDGKTDIAVYGYGRFAFNPSSGGPTRFFGFGGPEDVPLNLAEAFRRPAGGATVIRTQGTPLAAGGRLVVSSPGGAVLDFGAQALALAAGGPTAAARTASVPSPVASSPRPPVLGPPRRKPPAALLDPTASPAPPRVRAVESSGDDRGESGTTRRP